MLLSPVSRRNFFGSAGTLLGVLSLRSENRIPTPRFDFGQRVYEEYVCDDEIDTERYGKLLRFGGTVIGMVWNNPENKLLGWSYFILWDDHPSTASIDWYPYHETQLEAE